MAKISREIDVGRGMGRWIEIRRNAHVGLFDKVL